MLSHTYDRGERNWDSSDLYKDSEDLLGRWFKANPGKRENIFLATKFAIVVHPDGSRSVDCSPEYVKKACAKSLSRLGVSYIDLYYAHRMDPKVPIEKTVQAMKELQDEGESEHQASTLRL